MTHDIVKTVRLFREDFEKNTVKSPASTQAFLKDIGDINYNDAYDRMMRHMFGLTVTGEPHMGTEKGRKLARTLEFAASDLFLSS